MIGHISALIAIVVLLFTAKQYFKKMGDKKECPFLWNLMGFGSAVSAVLLLGYELGFWLWRLYCYVFAM